MSAARPARVVAATVPSWQFYAGIPLLERLHDAILLLIATKCRAADANSLGQTCRRLCHLVRISRQFELRLFMRDTQQLQQMPASRAFAQVQDLRVDLQESDLQEGCWDALASFLASSVQQWPGLQGVTLYGEDHMDMSDEPLGCLGAPLAALKAAANLRQLALCNVIYSSDFPHLEQLTQVTDLLIDCGSGYGYPLVQLYPPGAPLAALTHLKSLTLPWGWALTGEPAHAAVNDYNCPLALPPNLTYLSVKWLECSPGSLWRHIAACTALEELELTEVGEAASDHPSWAMHQLAGSLGRLRKLVVNLDGMHMNGNPVHRLARLLRLLYLPDEEAEAEELEAALQLAVPPVPVAGLHTDWAPHHMMLPPPNMSGFSSLEVLQLPGGPRTGWWLICSAPHHWQALAGCCRLKELEGLHAAQLPPPGVKFPGVTRLDMAVAPGDTLQVLRAFPALRELGITSVVGVECSQEPAGPLAAEQQPLPPLHPTGLQQPAMAVAVEQQQQQQQQQQQRPVFPGISRLVLEVEPPPWDAVSSSASSGAAGGSSSRPELEPCAAASYCSTLSAALPGLTSLELKWPQGMALPSLAAWAGLTSFRLQGRFLSTVDEEQQVAEVAAVMEMLRGRPELRQLALTMEVLEGRRARLRQEVQAVLPSLKEEEQPSLRHVRLDLRWS